MDTEHIEILKEKKYPNPIKKRIKDTSRNDVYGPGISCANDKQRRLWGMREVGGGSRIQKCDCVS